VWWWGYERITDSGGSFVSVVPRSNPPAQHCCPVRGGANTKDTERPRRALCVDRSTVESSGAALLPRSRWWEMQNQKFPWALCVARSTVESTVAAGLLRSRWRGHKTIRIPNGFPASVVPRSNPPVQRGCSVRDGGNTKDAEIPRRVFASVVPRSNPPKHQCCSGRVVGAAKNSEIPRRVFASVVPRSSPAEQRCFSGRGVWEYKDSEMPRRVFASVVPRSNPAEHQRCSVRGGVCSQRVQPQPLTPKRKHASDCKSRKSWRIQCQLS